jgi:hypothetical protein
MQSSTDPEFNDPVLKKAICRCWSCDCAPKELHNKISQLLQQDSTSPTNAFSPSSRARNLRQQISWILWPTALAALFLLSVSLLHHFHKPQADAPPTSLALAPAQLSPQPSPQSSSLPIAFESALIFRHDSCCSEPNHHHLSVSINDDAAIASALRARLNQPVAVYRPDQPGWVFRGASICPVAISPVAPTPAAHLVFARGNDTLSIFSLPHASLPSAAPGQTYTGDLNNHHILAFEKDNALFCLVTAGTGQDVSIDQLKTMQSQILPRIAQASPPILLTELLHTTGRNDE